MRLAKSIAFCQTSSSSKLNIFLSLNSQLTTLNFTYSFVALNARSRNLVIRDAIGEADLRLEIPMRRRRRGSHRRGAPRPRVFDAHRENVPRQIRHAPARQRTS